MDSLLISIIIPVYNAENYINKCLDSILAQTYKKFEIICIDDGSTDNSANIINRYSEQNANLKFIQQNNTGASAARNLGLRQASGEYIMFIDADDYIEQNMLEEMIKEAQISKFDYVVCGLCADYMNNDDELIKSTKYQLKPRRLYGNRIIANNILDLFENEKINGPCCKLIKKNVIYKYNINMPENIYLQEDLYFNVKVLSVIKSMSVISEPYYHYICRNVESVTKKYYEKKLEMLSFVNKEVIEYVSDRIDDTRKLQVIYYLYVKNLYSSFIDLFHIDCKKSKKEKIDYIASTIKTKEFYTNIKLANKNGIKYKVLLYIMKTKNKYIIYYICKILFFLKKYLKLRY